MRFLRLASFLVACACFHSADAGEPVSLIKGDSLEGWTQRGGEAKYSIKNGVIVGESVVNTPNSFLCTDRDYSDFILDVDLKVDMGLNSGIQIRSHVAEEPQVVETKTSSGQIRKKTIPVGRVHGYQVEIDTSERAWSGGIYDEGRRGWLNDLSGDQNEAARKAFKNGEWNHYRIQAIGNSIKTWVNGVPAADLTDGMDASGFIALQVHGIGDNASRAGTKVRWKNIQIQEVKADETAKKEYIDYSGSKGAGVGKKVVLIAGDEEYRSEETLPQLALILSKQHGFDCRVVFPINPETGFIDPNYGENIPGLEALEDADLMIIATRFRALPDEQMQYIDRYLQRGGPVLGLRTATHAFNFPKGSSWSHYSNGYNGPKEAWQDGFGRLVLGEKWISHHGKHKSQSTRGVIVEDQSGHPILRGVEGIWGPTDVYGVRLPLPGDSQPLVLGQVVNRAGEATEGDPLYGMRDTDTELDDSKNDPMMPIVWTKSYQVPEGEVGQVVTTTMGSSTDLVNDGFRQLVVNSVLWLTGLEEQIPTTGASSEIVGEFVPTAFEFRRGDYWPTRQMTVESIEAE
ncbi:family 16 glycoside hydrolase [Thalassoglobus sp. JC818]|uniref:family 16 glycoside hydrolase n=1 Tax=Thalassoglobus sp. JC818 TaxID=3232136 RepID=UPI003457F7C0